MNVTILGAGSLSIAISNILRMNNHKVKMWTYSEQEKNDIIENGENSRALPGFKIDKDIDITTDMKYAIKDSEVIVYAIPSSNIRSVSKQLKEYLNNQILVIGSKGIEEHTMKMLNEIVEEETGSKNIAILCGPSHAEEIAMHIPTIVNIASYNIEIADKCKQIFETKYFKLEVTEDVRGTELCSSIKNIIAFGCGMIEGVGYGDNTKAAFIVKALKELSDFGIVAGIKKETIYGLPGLGDIIVTGMSSHSRNMNAGILVGKGFSIDEAKNKIGMVVESANAIQGMYELAKSNNIELPIVTGFYNLLLGKEENQISPKETVDKVLEMM